MLRPGGNPPGRRHFQGEQLNLPPPRAIAIVFGENRAPSARAPGCGRRNKRGLQEGNASEPSKGSLAAEEVLLIFITFVLSNNLRLTFLRFPFWDSEIAPGALVAPGAAGEALDFFFGVARLVPSLSLHLGQSPLCFSICISRGPA